VPNYGAAMELKVNRLSLFRRPLGALLTALFLLLLPATANAQFLINTSFNAANVVSGENSILTIQISNNTTTIATGLAITDNLPTIPAGLTVAAGGLLSNSCGGTVTAVPNATVISISGGTVPASAAGNPGTCLFTVQVVANPTTPPATYVNTIPPANVSSSIGGTAAPASATLFVAAIKPITGTKAFAAANIHGGGAPTRMTITLSQANTIALTGIAFTDSFPAQLQLAPAPNLANTCGGTVTAVGSGTSVALSGGSIPAGGSCAISVDVLARNPNTTPFNGTATNNIAATGVTSTLGATNIAAISGSVVVQTAAVIAEAFSPTSIIAGTNSNLTLTLSNFNATSISGFSFANALPTGVTVVGPTTTTCGGTVTATATSIGVTGATLAAAPAAAGSTSCTISTVVTSTAAGSYPNPIIAGSIAGVSYAATTATLTVTAITPVTVTKAFATTSAARGSTQTLTITLSNPNLSSSAPITSFADNLNTMGAGFTIGGTVTTTCGSTVTAVSGTTLLSLSGGVIPIATSGGGGGPGTCTITVPVAIGAGAAIATSTNTIPVGALQTTLGNNTAAATDTLVINGANASKAFSPTSAPIGVNSTLTITLTNSDTTTAAAITSFSDNLNTMGAGLAIVSGTTTCGGTLSAVAGATLISLSGGTIPIAPSTTTTGSCTITVIVAVGATASIGQRTNTINAGALQTSVGNNQANATARLRVTTTTVAKSFSPTSAARGGLSTLTITLSNPDTGGSATVTSFTDNLTTMGAGFTVGGTGSTTCGGSLTATVGTTTIGLTGGTIPVAPSATTSGTCTITVPVMVATSVTLASATNTVSPGALQTTQGNNTNTANATLSINSVAVTKAFANGTVPRGGTTTLTITLSNPDTVSAVAITSLTDNLNTMGAAFTIAALPAASTTCLGSALTAVAGTTAITLTGGTIPIALNATTPGTCTVTVTVQVSSTAPLVAATNSIPVGALVTAAGNSLVAATAILTPTDTMTLSKAFSVSPVAIGGVTRLTITIQRVARAPLFTNLTVTDPLPGGFVVAPTPAASTTCTAGVVTATSGSSSVTLSGASLGTVVATATQCSYSVNVLAPATLATYTNTIPIGNATATTAGGTVSNAAAASASIQVIDGLRLNKSFSPTNIAPNGTSRLTVYITNAAAGAISLTGVSLTDTLPTGLVLKSPPSATLIATVGSCTGTISAVAGAGSVGISGGTISAGAACELSVDVTTSAIGSMTNTLPPNIVTSTQGTTNVNTASATLVSAGSADVAITKSDGAGVTSMVAGTSTTYTLVVKNNSTLFSVVGIPVSDTPPTDMTITGWTCSASAGSSCTDPSGSGAISTSVSLLPLGTATYLVTSLLASGTAASTITNTAVINPPASGVIDTDPSNNSASDTNSITRSADIQVVKTASNAVAPIGGSLTFTITVTNNGPSDAAAVSVADTLPSGYTFVGATPSVGSFTAPTWTIGTLAKGATATLNIMTTVRPTGVYANTATGTTTTPDPVPGNNSSTVTLGTINVTATKVSRLISDPVNGTTNPKMIPGALVEYTITVSNAGTSPIDANTVVVSDPLPVELAPYVSTAAGAPVTFVDGTPSSGLTFVYGSNVTWSNQLGGGAPFAYSPVPDIDGVDSAATGLRVNPVGTMAATSSFSIIFKAQIK
jgi:uncharacterized repeat protein (TIGR01451 family)